MVVILVNKFCVLIIDSFKCRQFIISTLYYLHKCGNDIQKKSVNCALIYVIDDDILFILKGLAISIVISFTLPRLGIRIYIMFCFVSVTFVVLPACNVFSFECHFSTLLPVLIPISLCAVVLWNLK